MDTIFQLQSDSLPHITYLGITVTPEHWKHFRRKCPEYVLYMITSGEMYLNEENRQYHLHPGDTLLLEPDMEHHGYDYSSCTYIYAHFSAASFQRLIHCAETEPQKLIQETLHIHYNESPLSDTLYTDTFLRFPKYMHIESRTVFSQITGLVNEAMLQNHSRQVFYKSLTSCYFMEIFSILSRVWMDDAFSHSRMDISGTMYEKTGELLDYLHRCYPEKITGSSLEQHFSVNFDYLNRTFRKRTGTTIFAYLNQIRLEQAKQLLLTTRLSMNGIAAETGFSDEYYFNRFFKKETGITPAKYRRGFTGEPAEGSF